MPGAKRKTPNKPKSSIVEIVLPRGRLRYLDYTIAGDTFTGNREGQKSPIERQVVRNGSDV